MRLGVCYYPEHWPETQWSDDARRMSELGISVVRIGEFAWSRLEPSSGQLNFDWLERAINVLSEAGLVVVLGTPTATPPKWLVDRHPDVLAIDATGQTRHFGSRRHYCFSSRTYREQCRRIVQLLAEHFGQHNAVIAWQTDNEYGCHDTTLSYSTEALHGFRRWCAQRYTDIDELNQLWGNVFWSMEYPSFDQIELPISTVTEANPAHRMAFWQYSSDQVRSFNKIQVDILRKLSPGRDLIHNFMGNFPDFDHYAVGSDLDVASWDNYPLGFLDRDSNDSTIKQQYLRTGHPDSSAFHHDLYRGVGRGRCWVMEQQPGPVNWAPHNPAPLDGMIRLWGWEAYAHGVEVMSWFRWRQAPFAQEQLHTGLCRSDGQFDTAADEVATLGTELTLLQQQLDSRNIELPNLSTTKASIAIIHDYAAQEMQRILRFGGDAHDPADYTLSIYTACRRCGLNVDIIPASADLDGYEAILLPNYTFSDSQLVDKLLALDCAILLFPGTGSRTRDCTIPADLAPGAFRKLVDIGVTRMESVPDFVKLVANTQQHTYTASHWRERIDSELPSEGRFSDGWGFHYRSGNVHYLNAKLDGSELQNFMAQWLKDHGVEITHCKSGLRLQSRGPVRFAFNYGPEPVDLPTSVKPLIGGSRLEPAQLAIWLEAHENLS